MVDAREHKEAAYPWILVYAGAAGAVDVGMPGRCSGARTGVGPGQKPAGAGCRGTAGVKLEILAVRVGEMSLDDGEPLIRWIEVRGCGCKRSGAGGCRIDHGGRAKPGIVGEVQEGAGGGHKRSGAGECRKSAVRGAGAQLEVKGPAGAGSSVVDAQRQRGPRSCRGCGVRAGGCKQEGQEECARKFEPKRGTRGLECGEAAHAHLAQFGITYGVRPKCHRDAEGLGSQMKSAQNGKYSHPARALRAPTLKPRDNAAVRSTTAHALLPPEKDTPELRPYIWKVDSWYGRRKIPKAVRSNLQTSLSSSSRHASFDVSPMARFAEEPVESSLQIVLSPNIEPELRDWIAANAGAGGPSLIWMSQEQAMSML
ncbi:hypothetical protein C8F04DRAFT_1195794 [Mycena alexandri]|uniref:Uncharacterized protein n=1 Tax=Mycena alexandri TaxID=1745969 RepID=A0AAD6WNH8_9AGAR|nr:hypothetical protein C8F04DRAFT_1195794 [Mycena alexandri]